MRSVDALAYLVHIPILGVPLLGGLIGISFDIDHIPEAIGLHTLSRPLHPLFGVLSSIAGLSLLVLDPKCDLKSDYWRWCVVRILYPKKCPYTDGTKCSLCWWLK